MLDRTQEPLLDAIEGEETGLSLVSSSANLTSVLNHVEQQVFANLNLIPEDEILKTRKRAKLLSKSAWRIEAGCDAQTVKRARESGASVMAAVRKRAKEAGCTPKYIFRNAQIFNLILVVETRLLEKTADLALLDERGYYNTALMAADPPAAIFTFAEQKKVLKRFRVTDALRYIQRHGLTKKAAVIKAVAKARAESISDYRSTESAHINQVIQLIKREVLKESPNEEISRIHSSYIEELREYIGEFLFDEDIAAVLTEAWISGAKNEEQFWKETGFPPDVVAQEMGMLDDLGKFIKVPGPGPQRWHMVGQPVPEELRRRSG